MYPCIVDAEGHVISFPPITNSEKTKVCISLFLLVLIIWFSNEGRLLYGGNVNPKKTELNY